MIDIEELRRLAQTVQSPVHNINERVDAIHNLHDALPSGVVLELLDRLEAAESDALEQARLNGMGSEREAAMMAKLSAAEEDVAHQANLVESVLRVAKGWERKCDALRAKIEQMEKQEPARLVTPTAYRWRYRGAVKWQYGELTEETARVAKEHNHEVQALGILPGAKGE